jgi:hypothetical protein
MHQQAEGVGALHQISGRQQNPVGFVDPAVAVDVDTGAAPSPRICA